MLTKKYLDQLDSSSLYMIASDHYKLDLDQYADEKWSVDFEKLIADILKQQEKTISSLPSGLLEQAKKSSFELQEEVNIITKGDEHKIVTNKELYAYGVSLRRSKHPYHGWEIILVIGEEHEG